MKKTLQLLTIAFVISIIGMADFVPSNTAHAGDDESSARMSEETSRYIREMKIQLRGADSEFYSNKTEQVYLLNSEETVKLDTRKTFKSTVAVINHKDSGGKNSFYVIEQQITPGKITFFLKKDSKVLQSLPVQVRLARRPARAKQTGPGVGCQQSDCDEINQHAAAEDAYWASIANQTCARQTYCVDLCYCVANVLSVPATIKYVNPTSRRCWKFTAQFTSAAQFWLVPAGGRLLDHAFDMAIKKEAQLYTL